MYLDYVGKIAKFNYSKEKKKKRTGSSETASAQVGPYRKKTEKCALFLILVHSFLNLVHTFIGTLSPVFVTIFVINSFKKRYRCKKRRFHSCTNKNGLIFFFTLYCDGNVGADYKKS